jgi:hypothetical protein
MTKSRFGAKGKAETIQNLMTVKNTGTTSRRGATIIEFALIFALLMVLTLGLIQYGVILNTTLALSHVSREGGRYAAVRALQNDVDDDIKRYIISVGQQKGDILTSSDITLSPPQNTAANPTSRRQYAPLTITITYDMKNKLFLPTTFFGVRFFDGKRIEETQMVME